MKIGNALKLSGLTVKTVRYYSNRGIICTQKNLNTGYRDFSKEDVAKLQFVGRARKFGFSTQACRDLLPLHQDKNRSSKEVKLLTLANISEKDKKPDELKDLRKQLNALALSCKGNDRPIAQFWMRYPIDFER